MATFFLSKKHGEVPVEVVEVSGGKGYITLTWTSPIGFGEYTVYNSKEEGKFKVDSECMDALPDLAFLKALLQSLIESITAVTG